jgi:hypothetical protein
MTNTSRLLGVLVFATFLAYLIGCNKNSDDAGVNLAESTMSYKIDGHENKLTTCIATAQSGGTLTNLNISALTATDSSKALSITMASDGEIKTGFTFNQGSVTDAAEGFISYVENSKGYITMTTHDKSTARVEVHITERTATNVKGTFTGKLFSQDSASETPVYTITEGKFNAKIQNN